MARNGGRVAMPAVDYETMPFPFAGDGSLEGLMQQLVRRGSAKRGGANCFSFERWGHGCHLQVLGYTHGEVVAPKQGPPLAKARCSLSREPSPGCDLFADWDEDHTL